MFDRNKLATTEFYQHRFRNFATLTILPATLLLVCALIFMLVAKREVTVKTVGELTPVAAPASVQSTANAEIVSNKLSEGKYVRKGEILLTYHNAQTPAENELLIKQKRRLTGKASALKILQQSVASNQDQFVKDDKYGLRKLLSDYLEQRQSYQLEAQQISSKQSSTNSKIASSRGLLQEQINRSSSAIDDYQKLYSTITKGTTYPNDGIHKGMYNSFKSEADDASGNDRQKVVAEYQEQIQNQIETAQGNLDNLKLQQAQLNDSDTSSLQISEITTKENSLQAEQLKNISAQQNDVQQSLDDLQEKQIELKDASKNYHIIAPKTGILHVDQSLVGKKRVTGGTELAEIMPRISTQNTAKISFFVSATAITSIHSGQMVRFKLARDIPIPIVMNAKIISVAAGPTASKAGNVFEATALVKLSARDVTKLHYGMSGQVSVITGKKTYWNYVSDRLFSHDG